MHPPARTLRWCALLLAGATAAAQEAPGAAGSAQDSPPAVEIVIAGRHQGPRLWIVHGGDHTLWILGTTSPLPKNMVWQPDAVQEVLKHVQEVVPAWPRYGIGANPLTALRVYIEWRHLQKPPDAMPLRAALPAPLYARVEALKERYVAFVWKEQAYAPAKIIARGSKSFALSCPLWAERNTGE